MSGEREIRINRLFQNKSLFVFQWFDPSDNGRRERDGAFLYHYVDLCLIIVVRGTTNASSELIKRVACGATVIDINDESMV